MVKTLEMSPSMLGWGGEWWIFSSEPDDNLLHSVIQVTPRS